MIGLAVSLKSSLSMVFITMNRFEFTLNYGFEIVDDLFQETLVVEVAKEVI